MAKQAPVTRSPNFPTMGTSAYSLGVDAPRPADFRAGMMVPEHGKNAGPDNAGTATRRSGTQIPSGGALHRVVVGHRATSETYPSTLAAGPILPAALGTHKNFYASGRYGPQL